MRWEILEQLEPENDYVAVPVSLKFLTNRKKRKISALLQAYRAAVNFFIPIVWTNPKAKLDAATLRLLPKLNTRLSERYKSQALKQAIDVCRTTKKSAFSLGVSASMPIFRGGAKLDAKFVKVVNRTKPTFDLAIELSEMEGHRGKKRMFLPTKRSKVFNKWVDWEQQCNGVKFKASLVQGCELTEDYAILWFKLPVMPYRTHGIEIGVDVGKHKMLVTSDNLQLGKDYSEICNAVRRKKPGSKGKQRAIACRTQYINEVVKQLPWDSMSVVGIEDLRGMKTGKKKGRGKKFRKALAPWTYRQPRIRILQLARANRVRSVVVDPRDSSRTCPDCGTADKLNRRGEDFDCVSCVYKGDADHVGAINVLVRTRETMRSLESRIAI